MASRRDHSHSGKSPVGDQRKEIRRVAIKPVGP